MEWTRDVQDALAAPFPEDEIEFLPRAASNGRALALAHIDARSVMRRLDAVVGADGWEFDFDVLSPDCKKLKGRLTVLGVTKCDAGEASTEDEPLKSAVSDALKRCAVHFGIARYLYYLPQLWVNYDAARRRFADPPRLPGGAVERALAVCGYRSGDGAQAAGEAAPQVVRERRPRLKTDGADAPEPARELAPAAITCASAGCGKPLTRGQQDVSLRAFGQPLCPACQRQQARAA
jgi:hypothetical protein